MAAIAFPRRSLAKPVMFSVRIGFRLWGMAEEPFWPFVNQLFCFEYFRSLPVTHSTPFLQSRPNHGKVEK